MEEPVIQRRIAQFTYRWTARFRSRGGEAIEKLLREYEEVEPRPDEVVLRSEKARRELVLGGQKVWVSWEGDTQETTFIERAAKAYNTVAAALGELELGRVSLRQMALVPFGTFDAAHDAVMNGLLRSGRELAGFPAPINDISIVLESTESDPRTRVIIGPIQKDEFLEKHKTTFHWPGDVEVDCGVYVDTDVWRAPQAKPLPELRALLGRATMLREACVGRLEEATNHDCAS